MEPEELKEVIAQHAIWIKNHTEGKKADLTGADLHGTILSGVDLYHANLDGANLSGTNLSGASLDRAILSEAGLSGANLTKVDLRGADLRGADLSDADLSDADLSDADLSGTNLSGTILIGANLSGTILSGDNGGLPSYNETKRDVHSFEERVYAVFERDGCIVRTFTNWTELLVKAVSEHESPSPHWKVNVEKELLAELSAGNFMKGRCIDFNEMLKRLQIADVMN